MAEIASIDFLSDYLGQELQAISELPHTLRAEDATGLLNGLRCATLLSIPLWAAILYALRALFG